MSIQDRIIAANTIFHDTFRPERARQSYLNVKVGTQYIGDRDWILEVKVEHQSTEEDENPTEPIHSAIESGFGPTLLVTVISAKVTLPWALSGLETSNFGRTNVFPQIFAARYNQAATLAAEKNVPLPPYDPIVLEYLCNDSVTPESVITTIHLLTTPPTSYPKAIIDSLRNDDSQQSKDLVALYDARQATEPENLSTLLAPQWTLYHTFAATLLPPKYHHLLAPIEFTYRRHTIEQSLQAQKVNPDLLWKYGRVRRFLYEWPAIGPDVERPLLPPRWPSGDIVERAKKEAGIVKRSEELEGEKEGMVGRLVRSGSREGGVGSEGGADAGEQRGIMGGLISLARLMALNGRAGQ
ncbi:hypothetical protein HDV00_000618 [Rhizophlyctis rosea]|nr:hypothetical protein HDV00_000618 [Rhizophlyctis rosea]